MYAVILDLLFLALLFTFTIYFEVHPQHNITNRTTVIKRKNPLHNRTHNTMYSCNKEKNSKQNKFLFLHLILWILKTFYVFQYPSKKSFKTLFWSTNTSWMKNLKWQIKITFFKCQICYITMRCNTLQIKTPNCFFGIN